MNFSEPSPNENPRLRSGELAGTSSPGRRRRSARRGMIGRYTIHKLSHFVGYLDRTAASFFQPRRLAEEIELNDDESFRRALDAALIGISLYAASTAVSAAIIGARLDAAKFDHLLEELLAILLILILPPLVFYFLRRATNLDKQKYHRYLHCSGYFVAALSLALAAYSFFVMLITYFTYGNVGEWSTVTAATVNPSCLTMIEMYCAMSFAHMHAADRFNDLIGHHQYSKPNILYGFCVGGFLFLALAALLNHIAVLRRVMRIPYFYSLLFYVFYLTAFFYLYGNLHA